MGSGGGVHPGCWRAWDCRDGLTSTLLLVYAAMLLRITYMGVMIVRLFVEV